MKKALFRWRLNPQSEAEILELQSSGDAMGIGNGRRLPIGPGCQLGFASARAITRQERLRIHLYPDGIV